MAVVEAERIFSVVARYHCPLPDNNFHACVGMLSEGNFAEVACFPSEIRATGGDSCDTPRIFNWVYGLES